MKLNPGDIVHLKSGSCAMTVKVADGTQVKCVWFHEGDTKEATFPLACVEIRIIK